MADNAQLKAAISSVIKTNGTQAITGQVLQNALLSMINSLGANYQFVGIATTSTNPGTPDQNVFYLAGEGTYTNFSNITIDVGQLGVLKWNGTWSKQVLEIGAGGGNMILDWNTDVATTRKQVLQKYRKPGMQISYNEPEKGWINEQYIGTSVTDIEWVKDSNWVFIPKQSEVTELSGKVGDILGTEEEILYENLELSSNQTLYLPTNISDSTLVQVSLLKTGTTDLIFYAFDGSGQQTTYKLKYNFPISIVYKQCKSLKIYFTGVSKINVKITLLAKKGLIENANRLIFQGCYAYNIKINDLGLKAGEQILIKNIVTPISENPVQFYVYKNDESSYIAEITPNNETILTIAEDVEKYRISIPYGAQNLYDSVVEVYLISSSNELTNQIISQPLSEYDFIASGDSITAWNGTIDTEVPGVEKFEGWANLLNAQIGFKTYKNIAVPGAGYTQSSVYGATSYSINRAIKNGLPEGFEGIFTMMGGTNDYNGTKSLGTAEETMAKTYEELNEINETSNFDTICDGFRYCLETAIRLCSWRARIFVMTCVPRNDKPDYFTVAEMNEQIKLISKAFNVPVLDLFSELNFRNGLDQFGETWKLSENPENVHPNAEAQKMMMRFTFGKIVTYIK
jgi:lysophospholipase L1-like esterase